MTWINLECLILVIQISSSLLAPNMAKMVIWIFPKRWEEIWNGQKWPFQISCDNFPKKTGINLEWPEMAVSNFSQKDKEIGMLIEHYKWLEEIWNSQNWAFQIYSNLFGAKSWKKFGIAKIGHSKFIQTFWQGRNSEWPKLGILNLFKPFWC